MSEKKNEGGSASPDTQAVSSLEKAKYYSEERKLLIGMEERAASSFDKTVTTLSAGALGLSIAFVRETAHTLHSETIWLLVAAWLGLGLSLFVTLLSFLVSQENIKRARELTDLLWNQTQPAQKTADLGLRVDRLSRLTAVLNWSSITFFAFGVIFLAWFTVKNLPTMEDSMTNNSNKVVAPGDGQRGVIPPKPPAGPSGPTPAQNPGAVPKK